MRHTKLILILIIGLALGALISRGVPYIVGGSMTVNGTTNMPAVGGDTWIATQPALALQWGALTTSNEFTVNYQTTIDGANWTTLATFTPNNTAASNYLWTPVIRGVTNQYRVQIVTTNAVTNVAAALQIGR